MDVNLEEKVKSELLKLTEQHQHALGQMAILQIAVVLHPPLLAEANRPNPVEQNQAAVILAAVVAQIKRREFDEPIKIPGPIRKIPLTGANSTSARLYVYFGPTEKLQYDCRFESYTCDGGMLQLQL